MTDTALATALGERYAAVVVYWHRAAVPSEHRGQWIDGTALVLAVSRARHPAHGPVTVTINVPTDLLAEDPSDTLAEVCAQVDAAVAHALAEVDQ